MTAPRILVVDDEPGMLRVIERVLGPPYQLWSTVSSRDALDVAAQVTPDLALLDVRMPELDGFELMAQLKGRQPDLDVILMTGSLDDRNEKLVRALRGAAFYIIQKPFDRDALRALVERCLELRFRRQENRRHVQRLERELAAARAFQQSLLPPAEATLGAVRLACRQVASSELGGDLYDYAHDGAGRTAVLVADVAGHGAVAAMLTGVVKSAFRSTADDDYAPVAVADRVWTALAPFGLERFVTLFAARVSPNDDRLTYVNAGHPSGLLWNAQGRMEWLASTGPLISPALPGAQWHETSTAFRGGDHLLLYTDGVTDAFPREHDGGARLRAVVERHADGGAALLDAVLRDIRVHASGPTPSDDVTMLAATRL